MPDVPNTSGAGAAALFIAVSGPGMFNGLIPSRIFEKGAREDIISAEVVAGGIIVGIGIAASYKTSSGLPFLAAVGVVAVIVYLQERAMTDRFKREGRHGEQVSGLYQWDE